MKKAVLHTTTLMQCKAIQVLHDLSSTNQRNGSEMTGPTKAHVKIWKPSYGWMTSCRQQSEDINYILMEDLNLWPILSEVLLELIN